AGSEATALDVAVMVVAASVFTLTGVIAWRRRPSNRCGMLMIGTGLSFALAGLSDADIAPLEIVGDLAQTLPVAAVLHLLMAYPSGRVSSPIARAVVVAGYVVALGLQIPRVLVGSVHGPLHVGGAPPTGGPFEVAQAVLGVALFATAIVILVVRARSASPVVRRALGPLRWFGPLTLGLAGAGAVLTAFLVPSTRPSVAVVIQLVAVIGLPIVFLIGLLRGAFGRSGELRELLEGIEKAPIGHDELRALLARTLGDESLRVLYRREDNGGFVDETGVAVAPDPARRRVDVALQGSVAGALDFDPMVTDVDRVAEVARIAALTLAHQRLTVELRASVHDLETAAEALREAQGRIVTATDRERRRIAGDLHDGAQQRIVALGLQAQQIARRPDVSAATVERLRSLTSGLESVVDELRALVRGIMPAALVDRGIEAATRELADRSPIPVVLDARRLDDRLPQAVESTAYFVVAESLTNALKHARSSYVEVDLQRDGDRLMVEVRDDGLGGADMTAGAGLRGLGDRVSALGGRFDVGDRPGGGTVVRAELPCAL
ncbi:MAG TPA: histidine kinase, partial [Agromyces sp.]|nr:histidine kinase [Agromyces sp.]